MAVVPYNRHSLSPQAADLVRRIARQILDEPADLMDQVYVAVAAAADEPLRSEPVLAAEVAASTQANVLHWAASMERDPGGRVPANLRDTLCVYIAEQFSAARAARALYTHRNTVLNRLQRAERLLPLPLAGHGLEVGVALEIAQWLGTQPGKTTHVG